MPNPTLINAHREVQNAAKAVLATLTSKISAIDSEESIANYAYHALCGLGFPETWYYACPAFVLASSRSCLSISGREYLPSKEPIGELGLVTVDLSPMRYGRWGDCARSFYLENGRPTSAPCSPQLRTGKQSPQTSRRAVLYFRASRPRSWRALGVQTREHLLFQ